MVLEQNLAVFVFGKIHSCSSGLTHQVTNLPKIFYVSLHGEPACTALIQKIET